jgi:hypothetical protein
MKHRNQAAAACRSVDQDTERVLKALEEATHGRVNTSHPITEQLKQCPEAFKVGEILGKTFDSLKYAQGEEARGERYFPPCGTVIPPLV